MAEFPALPMWTDAILADCGYMSDEKFGAYHRLLYLIWRSPMCKVPNDDAWLAERLQRPIEVVRGLYRQFITTDEKDVAEVLCRTDGNWIFQKRLLSEKKYLSSQKKKQSDRAKSRWKKEKDSCRGNATCGNAPTPTPTPQESITNVIDSPPPPSTQENETIPEKAKEKKNGTKTLLPSDFQPDEESRRLAAQLGVDLNSCLGEFTDWCRSKRPMYADWQATFRNSLRRASSRGGSGQGRNSYGRPEPRDITGAALRVAARYSQKG